MADASPALFAWDPSCLSPGLLSLHVEQQDDAPFSTVTGSTRCLIPEEDRRKRAPEDCRLLPLELLWYIFGLAFEDVSLEHLVPLRRVSRSWQAAVQAHPTYSRDISYWPCSESAGPPFPLLQFRSRILCSQRPFRLSLSALHIPSDILQVVLDDLSANLHRVQDLRLEFSLANAKAVGHALTKPAPMLELFELRFVRPGRAAGDAPLSSGCAVLPPLVFAGDAPVLRSVELTDVTLGFSAYPVLANVRRVAIRATDSGCVHPEDLFELCPLLEDLDVTDTELCYVMPDGNACDRIACLFPKAVVNGPRPMQPLQSVRLSSNSQDTFAEEWVLKRVVDQTTPLLTLIVPSEDAMKNMFEHLADSEALVFAARDDPTYERFFLEVIDPASGRQRAVEVPDEFWLALDDDSRNWDDEYGVHIGSALLPIASRITALQLNVRDVRYMRDIVVTWSAVAVVRIDIDEEDADSIINGHNIASVDEGFQVIKSSFPVLQLVLLCSPDGPSPADMEDFARWAAETFFTQEALHLYAAYSTHTELASEVACDPRTARTRPLCRVWDWDAPGDVAHAEQDHSLDEALIEKLEQR